MENNLSKEILGKIAEEGIKPKPRWQFLLKDYSIWASGVLALVIGGLAMAVVIYLLRYNDWSVYSQITDSFINFILLTMPYFWLLFLGIFILIVNYNLKHTKKGYKYPLPMIVGATIFISILMGGLFYKVGLGQAIDDILGEKAPLYTKLFNRQIEMWNNPEKGRLIGMVVSKDTDTTFLLLDRSRDEWKILVSSTRTIKPETIEIGCPVKVLGKVQGEFVFKAHEVLPAGPGRSMFRHLEGDVHKRMPNDLFEKMIKDPEFKHRLENMPDILNKYPQLKEAMENNFRLNQGRLLPLLEKEPEIKEIFMRYRASTSENK